jgi:tetratricopeptide (TPR) repeat protein
MPKTKLMRSLFILPLLIALFALSANAQTINFPKDAPLHAEFNAKRGDFHRVIYQAYERFTKDPESIQPAVRTFLDRYLDYFAESLLNGKDDSEAGELTELAESLVKKGSTDPLLLRTLAFLYNSKLEAQKGYSLSRQALKQFGVGSYPAGLELLSVIDLQTAGDLIDPKNPGFFEELRFLASDRIADWFTFVQHESGLPWDTNAKRFAMEKFIIATQECAKSPDAFQEGVKAYSDRVDREPDIDAFIQAYLLEKTAWRARGKKFVSETDPNRWRTYVELRKQSVQKYLEAYQLAPKQIVIAISLLSAAKEGFTSEPASEWFQTCVDIEPDHPGALGLYSSSLRDRWGGSVEKLIAAGKQFLRSKRFDTNIPYQYVTLVRRIQKEAKNDQWILAHPDVYDDLGKVFEGMFNHPSRQIDKGLSKIQVSILADQVFFAHRMQRFEEAKDLWQRLEGYTDHPKFSGLGLSPKYDQSYAHAISQWGEELSALLTAEEQFASKTGDFNGGDERKKMLASWNDLLRRNKDPVAELFLTARKQIVKKEIEYWNDQWVSLDFDPELNHWTGRHRLFSVGNHEWITFDSTETSNCFLDHRGTFPGPKEIKLQVFSQKRFFYNRCLFGIRVGSIDDQDSLRCYAVDPIGRHVSICKPSEKVNFQFYYSTPKFLHVKIWGPERIEFSVNGVTAWETSDADFNLANSKIGIGMPGKYYSRGKFVMTDFTVRRLLEDPPPALADYEDKTTFREASIEYYENATKTDPESHEAWHQLGNLHLFHDGDLSEALTAYQSALNITGKRLHSQEYLAHTLFLLKRYPESFAAFDKAMTLSRWRDRPRAKIIAEYAYRLTAVPDDKYKNVEKALKLIQGIMHETGEEFAILWAALANSQAANGNFDKARESIKMAEKIDEKPGVYLPLPFFYLPHPEIYTRRIQRIRQAIDQNTFDKFDFPKHTNS